MSEELAPRSMAEVCKKQRERIEALDKECEERIEAYKIAHNQAMENGQARREAEAARDKALADVERLEGALAEMTMLYTALKETSGEQDYT